MRRVSPLIAAAALACAGGDATPAAHTTATATSGAVAPGVAAVDTTFVPGFARDDPASAAVERFLALSVADAAGDPAALDELLACGLAPASDLPAELLADYAITGRSARGDTTVVRARVVTVAEQDRSRTAPGRFTASQRVREGEWEWDVVRDEDGAWRVCAGPRFGLVAPDSLTTWRPDGATAATARELAASLRGRLVAVPADAAAPPAP